MGEPKGRSSVLLNEEHGNTVLLVDDSNGVKDGLHEQWRETETRLVEEENAWLTHECPPNGEHLLLASAKSACQLLTTFGEDREELVYPSLRLLDGVPIFSGEGTEVEVLSDTEGTEETPSLRNLRNT